MTGLQDTDIRLDADYQLAPATDGDALLCTGLECQYQSIRLEALTQPGDLFYDAAFGWGLYDFIQSEDNELTRLEISQRARMGLQRRSVILPESIQVTISHEQDAFLLRCRFQFTAEDTPRQLNVIIDPVSVEVIADD